MHDAEQSASRGHALEGALAALGPGEGELHGAAQFGVHRRQPHAFVELHGDVGAEQVLDLDCALGRKLDGGAIEMRAEGHSLVLDLAQLRERHDLVAAGIGQNCARPAHECVQPAERRDALGARPQHEVIRIGKHNVGPDCPHRVRCEAFDRRLRADRQERGRGDAAVRGCHFPAAGGTVAGEQTEGEEIGHGGAGNLAVDRT